MAELRDPGLPPGEIAEKREDGIWVRNDGVELTSAEKNPYYVLATVFGQQGREADWELHAKNRRIWNGYVGGNLHSLDRSQLSERHGVSPEELSPLTQDETVLLQEVMESRLGRDASLPDLANVDFSSTFFFFPLEMGGFFLPSYSRFDSSHFQDWASFVRTKFMGQSSFYKTHFANSAYFIEAEFLDFVSFVGAQFTMDAQFQTAEFYGETMFGGSHFKQLALFDGTRHEGDTFLGARFSDTVVFDNGVFAKTADFRRARFERRVPRFFQRGFADDIGFSTIRDFWPKQAAFDLEESKDAYRRLRQISAAQHNPENEHFFLRQEMACSAEVQDNLLSKWVIKGFGFFSDYGYSVGRPLAGLLGVWAIGALAIQFVFAWAIVYGAPPPGMAAVPGFEDALGLGLANTFAIFGFRTFYFGEEYMSSLPAFVKIVCGAQTVLGFIFLFFLGLGLRNRFRLK